MQINQPQVNATNDPKANRSTTSEAALAAQGSAPAQTAEKPEALSSAQLENMSTYMKVVSRLENLHAREELPEVAVEGFVKGLNKRVSQMNDHEKALLLRVPAAQQMGASSADELVERIEEDLANPKTAVDTFKLLRNQEFANLMDPSKQKSVYHPQQMPQRPVAPTQPAPESAAPASAQPAPNAGVAITEPAAAPASAQPAPEAPAV